MDNTYSKIMVVDDEINNCKLIQAYLASFRVELFMAQSGSEAIDLCKSNPDISLVLMDISLNDMNGFEVARQILEINKEIIIIYQTAYAREFINDELMQHLVCAYIEKPIRKEVLLSEMSRFIKITPKEESAATDTEREFSIRNFLFHFKTKGKTALKF